VVERFASLGTEPVAPAFATPEALRSHGGYRRRFF